jgi:AraC-like DNA-binding protein
MRWSLSEFLNLLELRSQTWCFVCMDADSGIKIPHSETVYFYQVLEGAVTLAGASGESTALRAGDIVMVMSGEGHALRTQRGSAATSLDFLVSGEYADMPPTFSVGAGRPVTRLLAGRLKVRWPGGQHPKGLPAVLKVPAENNAVDFATLLHNSSATGASAVLTRAATLLFISAFRDHPRCQAVFQEFGRQDPIARAQQYIQTHPFNAWTVENIAQKVGMGRSSFATRFAREVGRTPIEYMSEERMKHAALFLEKTDMKIGEIGERVGYRSEAAFIRRFTACFGLTPGEMRRRARRSGEAMLAEPAHSFMAITSDAA